MSIPPTFLVLMPLLELKPLTIEKMGVSKGGTPPKKLRKMQILNSICKIWCFLPTFY